MGGGWQPRAEGQQGRCSSEDRWREWLALVLRAAETGTHWTWDIGGKGQEVGPLNGRKGSGGQVRAVGLRSEGGVKDMLRKLNIKI